MNKKNQNHRPAKLGSKKQKSISQISIGLNRRSFLRNASKATCIATISGFIPHISASEIEQKSQQNQNKDSIFSTSEQAVIAQVQQHLFPDDGNGPDAKQINAMNYLLSAMTDPRNVEDGDPAFLSQGVKWLEQLSEQSLGDAFLQLSWDRQAQLLSKIAQSQSGENWLALIMFYLTEALMLDPIYGGNTDGSGWSWLEHQAGFPRPEKGKTYRDFE